MKKALKVLGGVSLYAAGLVFCVTDLSPQASTGMAYTALVLSVLSTIAAGQAITLANLAANLGVSIAELAKRTHEMMVEAAGLETTDKQNEHTSPTE